jgi:hypothetical protein
VGGSRGASPITSRWVAESDILVRGGVRGVFAGHEMSPMSRLAMNCAGCGGSTTNPGPAVKVLEGGRYEGALWARQSAEICQSCKTRYDENDPVSALGYLQICAA